MSDVPPAVLDTICVASIRQLSETGGSVTLRIVAARETRPLVSELSLEALRARAGKISPVDISSEAQLLSHLRGNHISYQIRVPNDSACEWLQGDRPDPRELFLQLSSPFDNPYEPGERGVLARLSLGGSMGASWFWVVLRDSAAGPIVEDAESLDIHDG